MDSESLEKSINEYKEQLKQIELALPITKSGAEKNDLISLKADIEQLIELTQENLKQIDKNKPSTSKSNDIDDEYLLFMQEMAAEGVESNVKKKIEDVHRKELEEDFKSLEGMKCQAPHKHSWGGTTYHNALVFGVVHSENHSFNNIQVRVLFTNPTHLEMLPCPFYLEEGNCKFSDEKCKYSHGEIVQFSSLQEYKEPNFKNLKTGSSVLCKSNDKLWHRAIVRKLNDNNCLVKFESSKKEISVPLEEVLPLDSEEEGDSSESSSSEEESENDWAVQKSLLNTPSTGVLGDWEKHTKGIGSKLMQKMGYIIGTGLGRHSEGRIDPVEAVVLPSGKSLDHCMNLRELAGGDENLFSAERKLKKMQRKQEALSKKQYEKEKNKTDVFEFLNNTLTLSKENVKETKNKREDIRSGSNRDLNVTGFKIDEDMKKTEYEINKIKVNLTRHNNTESVMHINLKKQLQNKQNELERLKDYARNVKTEQNLRKDKKKLTIF